MLLSSLLDSLPSTLSARVVAPAIDATATRVSGRVTDRTQDVRDGDVFVAIRGARFDGHDHIPPNAGAVFVEREVEAPAGVPVVLVRSTPRALGHLCAVVEGRPGESLVLVGVTGTNGKTSVTYLVAHIARAFGWSAGLIGTTGHLLDGVAIGEGYTTPTAPQLQHLLATFRDRGATLVAMEVSSIGLAAHRVDGTTFSAAGFTNLTRDHLDFHGSMDTYAAAKMRLFTDLLRPGATAVLNAGDPVGLQIEALLRPDAAASGPSVAVSVALYGASGWTAQVVDESVRGSTLRVRDPQGVDHTARTPLFGGYNIENLLCAWALCHAVGIDERAIVEGLASFPGVPGRLERVSEAEPFDVFVDYAHTDDALRRVLQVVRPLTRGRLRVVFGCGGDRDPGKRPAMGAAARLADHVYATSDNPRSEDPLAIIAQILPGLGGHPHVVQPDRREAIRRAIADCAPGDVLIVAGKGHETTQAVGSQLLPFDDRRVCRRVLQALSPTQPGGSP